MTRATQGRCRHPQAERRTERRRGPYAHDIEICGSCGGWRWAGGQASRSAFATHCAPPAPYRASEAEPACDRLAQDGEGAR